MNSHWSCTVFEFEPGKILSKINHLFLTCCSHLALIAGACSLAKQDNPKPCLTKGGNKVDSIKKCLAQGCCFTIDPQKSKVQCFEQSGNSNDSGLSSGVTTVRNFSLKFPLKVTENWKVIIRLLYSATKLFVKVFISKFNFGTVSLVDKK